MFDDDFENEFNPEIINEETFDAAVEVFRAEYEKMAKENDEDYIPNPIQEMKLLRILAFLTKMAEDGDIVYPVNIQPKFKRGDIEADFEIFSLHGNEAVKQFCKLIECASAFGMHPTTDDKIHIDITIPNVFIRKTEVGE